MGVPFTTGEIIHHNEWGTHAIVMGSAGPIKIDVTNPEWPDLIRQMGKTTKTYEAGQILFVEEGKNPVFVGADGKSVCTMKAATEADIAALRQANNWLNGGNAQATERLSVEIPGQAVS